MTENSIKKDRNGENLKGYVINRAITLLFKDVTKEQHKKLSSYIKQRYAAVECVALYISEADHSAATPKGFLRLCKSLDLNPGKREVIITSGEKILFSMDYTKTPLPVL